MDCKHMGQCFINDLHKLILYVNSYTSFMDELPEVAKVSIFSLNEDPTHSCPEKRELLLVLNALLFALQCNDSSPFR